MSLHETLRILGLTDYEARAYISFIKHGEMTAKELSDESGLPYSKTYEVASNLEKKGLVEVHKARPMVFRALSPRTALKTYGEMFLGEIEGSFLERRASLDKSHHDRVSEISRSLHEASEDLHSYYEERGSITATDDLIWTIHGKENVISQIRELIMNSKSIKMILQGELLEQLGKELRSTKAKGDVILQAKVLDLFPISTDIRTHSMESIAFECGVVIGDDEKTIFTSKDFDVGFKSSNPGLSTILTHFFEHEKEEASLTTKGITDAA